MTRRRGRARQRDQPCLDLTGDLRLDRWGETFPALDRRGDITATLGVCPGHVRDGVGIDADPLRDLPTTGRPSTTVIELQQDPRSADLLRGMRTGPDHPGQPLTLIGAEYHRRQHRLRHDTSSWQGKEDCRDRSTASQPNVSGDTLLDPSRLTPGDRTIPEPARRIKCGHQLPAERFKLGYRYRVKANCQAVRHRGPVIRTVGSTPPSSTGRSAPPKPTPSSTSPYPSPRSSTSITATCAHTPSPSGPTACSPTTNDATSTPSPPCSPSTPPSWIKSCTTLASCSSRRDRPEPNSRSTSAASPCTPATRSSSPAKCSAAAPRSPLKPKPPACA